MSLQTMPIDTSALEFRFHGATEFKEFNRDTETRNKHQARDESTGYPIYSVRCQVIYRARRESGLITIRVPLPTPPGDNTEFEAPVSFTGATAKSWNMDGRDGQTWIAESMRFANAGNPGTNNKTVKSGKAA